jgi:hypothetical protein
MSDVNMRIRNLAGDQTAWGRGNPVIGRGELVVLFDGDHTRFKIGDGTLTFNELPFAVGASIAINYLQLVRPIVPRGVPVNSFFIDERDNELKFKNSAGQVRLVSLT